MATWSRHCFNNHVGIGSRAQDFVDDDVITFLTSDSETTLNWSIITADIYVVKFLYPISIQHALQQILEMDFRSQHISVKDSWKLWIHGPENTSGVHWNMDLTRLICYRYCCISNTFFPSWKWQRLVKMISETLYMYMFIVLWLMVYFIFLFESFKLFIIISLFWRNDLLSPLMTCNDFLTMTNEVITLSHTFWVTIR